MIDDGPEVDSLLKPFSHHDDHDDERRRTSVLTSAERARATLEELAAQDAAPKKSAVERLHDIALEADCATMLKAWFQYLDKDQSGRIDYSEFDKGLKEMKFTGGPKQTLKLWQELDSDMSGAISFDEFTLPEEAELWRTFCRFAGSTFSSGRDMLKRIQKQYADANAVDKVADKAVTEQELCESLVALGWTGGQESMFFDAFAIENEHQVRCIYARSMRWVDREAKMWKLKQAAKKKAEKMASLKQKSLHEARSALRSFKAFLKKHFGNMLRAWRKALDVDGSMTLQRSELFKAVKTLNWKGNCRALWQALDHDQSGITTIEELDPSSAQLLAYFREWALTVSPSKRPSEVFEVLDRFRRKKLSHTQFLQEVESRGFNRWSKQLVPILDWQEKDYLCVRDLEFLDVWRAPAWLTHVADPEAAQAFRKQLVARHGHILKAWRFAMDKDCSNSCNWHEFQEAAKLVRFHGNLAGAWLALDADCSGSISLKEIDPEAHECLTAFKTWADAEFSGVRSAFKVLDADGSGSLNFREFKSAVRMYGFTGDCKLLFQCLDQMGKGSLQMHEVSFLDNWTNEDLVAESELGSLDDGASSRRRFGENGDRLLEYYTENPGPGTYAMPGGFGASDRLGPLADDRSLHRKDKLLVCARDADRRESPICESLDAGTPPSPFHDNARLQLSATALTTQPALPVDDPCPLSPMINGHGSKGRNHRTSGTIRGWLSLTSSQESDKMSDVIGSCGTVEVRARWLRVLDKAAAALIFLNAVVMMVELELEGREAADILAGNASDQCEFIACRGGINSFLRLLSGTFDLLFFVELLVRIGLERELCRSLASTFDTLLAIAGLVPMVLVVMFEIGAVHGGVSLMYFIGVIRALRAIRLLRILRFCRGLQVFLSACKTFLSSLVWAVVLLAIFVSSSALIVGNMLQHYIRNPLQSVESRTWIWEHYGTAYNAVYTLFEVTFAGNWPTNVRPVLDDVSKLYVLFFGGYILIVVFALIRVITAILIKDTMEAAQNDAEFMVLDGMRKRSGYVKKLEGVFQAIDKSGRGVLTEARLNDILSNPSVKVYFQSLGVDLHEGVALFHLLDNGDGEVTLEEFVDGILRCKGQARAIDQVAIHADLKQLDAKLTKMTRIFTEVYPSLLRKSKQPAKTQPTSAGFMRRLSMDFERLLEDSVDVEVDADRPSDAVPQTPVSPSPASGERPAGSAEATPIAKVSGAAQHANTGPHCGQKRQAQPDSWSLVGLSGRLEDICRDIRRSVEHEFTLSERQLQAQFHADLEAHRLRAEALACQQQAKIEALEHEVKTTTKKLELKQKQVKESFALSLRVRQNFLARLAFERSFRAWQARAAEAKEEQLQNKLVSHQQGQRLVAALFASWRQDAQSGSRDRIIAHERAAAGAVRAKLFEQPPVLHGRINSSSEEAVSIVFFYDLLRA
ncbi:Poc5 [Symbiodinium pilosum]|uniref:Poc5 protein n=1 Tax=Symbiodinium pilosum TaxID=2952 RepID=A0A812ST10_SYMPI|nr:Poc5 [Symbiodinium pilosum]